MPVDELAGLENATYATPAPTPSTFVEQPDIGSDVEAPLLDRFAEGIDKFGQQFGAAARTYNTAYNAARTGAIPYFAPEEGTVYYNIQRYTKVFRMRI